MSYKQNKLTNYKLMNNKLMNYKLLNYKLMKHKLMTLYIKIKPLIDLEINKK